jgi:hypothetical protein
LTLFQQEELVYLFRKINGIIYRLGGAGSFSNLKIFAHAFRLCIAAFNRWLIRYSAQVVFD